MIVRRFPYSGRLVGVALEGHRRLIEMGDLFGTIPGMPYTQIMSVTPKQHINNRQFILISVARTWLRDLNNKQLKQQHDELSALLLWAETVDIAGPVLTTTSQRKRNAA